MASPPYESHQQKTIIDSIPDVVPRPTKNGYNSSKVRQVETGIFTLTLEKRPEKRERSRSGSDVISPNPKRIGPPETDVTRIEESDNGNVSPISTTTSSEGSSVFQTKGSPDTDDTLENVVVPTCTSDVITIVSPDAGCTHDDNDRPRVSNKWERTKSPDEANLQVNVRVQEYIYIIDGRTNILHRHHKRFTYHTCITNNTKAS